MSQSRSPEASGRPVGNDHLFLVPQSRSKSRSVGNDDTAADRAFGRAYVAPPLRVADFGRVFDIGPATNADATLKGSAT